MEIKYKGLKVTRKQCIVTDQMVMDELEQMRKNNPASIKITDRPAKTGDQVIISVARCLQETTRKNDVVMRLGGDEFVCFLYNAQTVEDAELYSQRLFHAIELIKIDKIPDIRVNVSIGAALYDGSERIDFSELYRRADEKVYDSKKITGNALTV